MLRSVYVHGMATQWFEVQFPEYRAWKAGEGNPLREVKVGGKRICLVRQGEKISAIDARCPHAGGPLAGGFLNEEGQVVCPWHRFGFSVETGQSESGGYFVTCYKVEVREMGLRIGIHKKRWWEW